MDIDTKKNSSIRSLILNFAIELLVYGILVVGYFYFVLRLLQTFLVDLFRSNLIIYAFVALVLIIAQGVLLEMVTSFILDLFKLDRLE